MLALGSLVGLVVAVLMPWIVDGRKRRPYRIFRPKARKVTGPYVAALKDALSILGVSDERQPAERSRAENTAWACAHFVLLCAFELAQVLQRRVEPLAILPQALLAVVDVAVDLHNLSLQHMPVRL